MWTCFLTLDNDLLIVSSCGERGKLPSLQLLIGALIPKTSPPNTMTLELGLQHKNWEEHKLSVYSANSWEALDNFIDSTFNIDPEVDFYLWLQGTISI